MKAERRLWPLVTMAGFGIVVLCGLGAWQVMRLGEKEQLLTELNARATATPLSLGDILSRAEKGEDVEFTHIAAQGAFDHAHRIYKQSVYDGGPGWQVITPFVATDGVAVLVDRGVIPGEMKNAPEAAGPATVSGIIRRHNSGQGLFDPENDASGNMWFWWDIPAMKAQAAFPPDAKVAPFILQALPDAAAPKFPKPDTPDAGIRNNHLQYAITWFSLALVLLAITILFIRRERRS